MSRRKISKVRQFSVELNLINLFSAYDLWLCEERRSFCVEGSSIVLPRVVGRLSSRIVTDNPK
jgi:hypothetical protein